MARNLSFALGIFLLIHAAANAAESKLGMGNSYPDPLFTPARMCTSTNRNDWVNVSGFCHLLMFYKLGNTDLPGFTNGQSMLTALTDENAAIAAFGESPFIRTVDGVRYCLFDDSFFHSKVGEVHRDQCLAIFAELNLPESTPIRLKSGSYSISNLISETVANFNLQEREVAWAAIALAHWLPPQREWTNRFGEKTTFADLTEHLIEMDLNNQSCVGTHVFEALGLIAKADQKFNILDSQTRKKLRDYINETFHDILQHQNEDGGWDKIWCLKIDNNLVGRMSLLECRVLVTAHLVQIMSEVDSSGEVPKEVYDKATRWLKRTLASPGLRIDNPGWLCPLSHAATCLSEFYQESNKPAPTGAVNFSQSTVQLNH